EHTFDFLQSQHRPDAYHAADRVVARTFTILGHKSHTFAQDIRWHQDFTCKQESPPAWQSTFYSDIVIPSHPSLPQPDIKVPWELSRLTCCRDLGYGYAHARLNNDGKRAYHYAQAFVTYIEDWTTHNPFLFGVNWVNPMEIALRGINLVSALHLFKHEPCITETFWTSYGTLLVHHIDYLEHNWEVSDRPNNHYLADLVGHFYLCTCLRFVARYNRAQCITAHKIFEQLKHQTLPDGTSYEGSTHYHKLVTELTELFIKLADHSDILLPTSLRTKFMLMQQFIRDCSDRTGRLVHIGDEDGGRVGNYWGSCFDTPAVHPEYAASACIEGHGRNSARTESKSTCYSPLITYPHFGLSIIKDSRIHLTFRHPTYTPHQPTGHFHNDQLSITLSINGIQLLVDPGTYCYTANATQRNYFRSFAAHNTWYIPSIAPDDMHLFMLNRQSHPPAQPAQMHNNVITLQDFYHATTALQLHRRVTYKPQSNTLEIYDWQKRKDDAIAHKIDMQWALHVAPDIVVVHETENRWVFMHNKTCLARLETSLAYTTHQDAVSPLYGTKVASTTLRAVTNSPTPQKMVFWLMCTKDYGI
ncbi:MAG: heparinase II/III family protein, partial [Candidatus Babeliales bacterium]